ncbi:hypothetical protein LVQ79_10350 [Buttiauxella sp. A2-C1_F]|uniref:hypothetical protein n=1 Tax=Buttiauxella sp. A2-C1_F TaxID=2904526 RepID=UPI001E40F853|nr:hypothetical protein [Buttiauxella sp. A2-C1_F]MCE0845944.1 hypothetical protein [Buttiauxella sp. A2-C1_F]
MDIQTTATDEGRIIALQVGFSTLVHMLSKDNPKFRDVLVNHLEETGMNPINASSSSAFYELAELLRGVGHINE